MVGAGLTAASLSGGLTACAPGRSGGSGSQGNGGGYGKTNLALAWWGNPTRNENTQKMIDAYMKANPDVQISPQPGEVSSYWDKLATQTAGGTAPDIIQMDMNYISEYGSRGALLDLGSVDTSKFVEGTVDSGRIDGKLVGINAGINSALIFVDPKIFDKAKMDLPSDTTWTWEEMMEVGAEVASKAKVPFGLAGLVGSDALFGTWVRQQGKELFTEEGIGFGPEEAKGWYDLMVKGQKLKALGSVEQISEESAKPLDQSAIVVGRAAMQYYNSNQLEAVRAAADNDEIDMLRGPSMTGNATDRKTWYKASMLWSASAKTENPEAAIAWINWFANSEEAASIDLAERGIPPHAGLLEFVTPKLSDAQQRVAKYITDIQNEVGETPIAPPPGGGTIAEKLFRHGTDVLFGRASTAEAAERFVDEVKSDLQV